MLASGRFLRSENHGGHLRECWSIQARAATELGHLACVGIYEWDARRETAREKERERGAEEQMSMYTKGASILQHSLSSHGSCLCSSRFLFPLSLICRSIRWCTQRMDDDDDDDVYTLSRRCSAEWPRSRSIVQINLVYSLLVHSERGNGPIVYSANRTREREGDFNLSHRFSPMSHEDNYQWSPRNGCCAINIRENNGRLVMLLSLVTTQHCREKWEINE